MSAMGYKLMRKGQQARIKIYKYVVAYIREHGYPPSVREIGDGVGLKSTSSVYSHLKRMLEEGMLETDAEFGQPRALRVPGYRFIKEDWNE